MALGNIILSSYGWSLAGQWVSRGIGIISTLVLIRLLSPDDFGIAALSVLVIMLFEQLSDSGESAYLLRLKEVTNNQLNTAWTLQLLFKFSATILIFILAPYIAVWMGDPRLEAVLYISGLGPLCSALKSPGFLMLEKDMRFDLISKIHVSTRIFSVVFTLILAALLRDYWALIFGTLIYVIFHMLLTYIVVPATPRFNLANFKEQFSYTKNILFVGVLGYVRSKIDVIVVNDRFGTTGVGLWNVGQEFAILPLSEIVTPMGQPLFSGLSRLRDQLNELSDKLLKYLSTVYLILLPSAVGINLLSEHITYIVMGEQWVGAEVVLKSLSWLMLVFVTINSFNIVYKIQAYFKVVYCIEILGLFLILLLLFSPLDFTFSEFAWYRLAIGVVVVLSAVSAGSFILKISFIHYLATLLVPVISSLFMWLCVSSSLNYFDEVTMIDFLVNVIVGVFSYTAIAVFLISFLRKTLPIWQYNHSMLLAGVSLASRIIRRS